MNVRRALSAMTVGTLVVVAAASALRTPTITAQPPGGRMSACTGTIAGTVSADTIRICDPLTVTVRVAPECPVCPGGVNVVYIQMDIADEGDWMIQESLSSLAVLRALADRYPVNVGVVRYERNQTLRMVLGLTSQINAAVSALSAPVADGFYEFGPYEEAVRMALNMLARVRSDGAAAASEACEYIVFFAFGKLTTRRAMLAAASMIHSADVSLFVGCPTDSMPYCTTAASMVKSARNYTEFNERGKLRRMFDQSMVELTNDRTVRDLYISQFLSPGLSYVDGSADVRPMRQARALDGRTRLDWEWKRFNSTAPLTVTYQARPLGEGVSAISGTLKLVDMSNLQRETVMPTTAVTVSGLCLPDPSPTPTDAASPTPTDTPTTEPTLATLPTPTPTSTVTPSPTATVTPTSTPTLGPIYLPLLLREQCAPDTRRVDVVLVIDASSSMTERTPAGRTKIDAAIAAARAFLDALRFDRGDQAAIVAFNAGATLLAPLTGDRAPLEAALAGIRTAQQTCIVCAVETAAAELNSPRHRSGHTATLILLTDGRSNPRPVKEAVDRAAEARARGVVVFTIGLGTEIDAAALAAMASRPAYFYRAPEAEGLADIYKQIAVEIPCPSETFWGGR